jgi:hypothetical protein
MFNVKVIGADGSANSGAVAKDLQATTGPARLYSAVVYNSTAGTLYFQLHDAAAVPADSTVPKLVVAVATKQAAFFDFSDGVQFGAGIYMCLSSTDTTKTLVGSTSGIFNATFRKTE